MKNKISAKLIILLGVVIMFLFILIRPYYVFFKKVTNISPIWFLLTKGTFKQTDAKVNFLLLGKPDTSYDGQNLTDSIMVFSLNLKNQKINLISLPRDIWSETLKDKINSAYAYGEAKKSGGGFLLAKAEIEAVLGQPIHYAILINFEEFKELIDYFGGVDIYIERGFSDFKYPIKGRENDLCGGDPQYKCRYEHLSFSKGWQHMNGDLALKFVRSRNAQGDEGSDFARNKRQQKVLMAIYEKTLSKIKKLNIKELEKMYSLIDKIVKRDISNKEAAYIGKRMFFSKNIKINRSALSEDFFTVPESTPYQGKYVLTPKSGTFNFVHHYINCIIAGENISLCDKFVPKDPER
jgi:LCP family protein required for cell wall assembly